MQSAQETTSFENTLYRHSKKKEWGLAFLAWEQDGKRGYRFEDGEERVFAAAYYGLLEAVDPPTGTATALLNELKRHNRGKGETDKSPITFEEQFAVFLDQYTGGFSDADWIAKHRNDGSRRLKRHRDPAIAAARAALSPEALDKALASSQHHDIRKAILDVLEGTDLVSKPQLEPIKKAKPDANLIKALRNFLHGDEDFGARFDAFCRELATNSGRPAAWPLISAIPALVHPDRYICVRPSVLGTQATHSTVSVRNSKQPNSRAYIGYLEVAKDLETKLTEAGQAPRDLFDVYDFIWATMRPAALEILQRVRQRRRQKNAANTAAASHDNDEAPVATH